jgi:hypothetical protein
MVCDQDSLRRRLRESTAARKRHERCFRTVRKRLIPKVLPSAGQSKRGSIARIMPSGAAKEYSSHGGGLLVGFSRILMASGECRPNAEGLGEIDKFMVE